MSNKPFRSFEQQIKILKSRGLKFNSEENAIRALKDYGYYNIINGYKDPYVSFDNGIESFNEGVTFDQIFSLFQMDQLVSFSIMNAMLRLEMNLKTVTAYAIAESFSADQTKYLDRTNYRSGKSRTNYNGHKSSQLDDILRKFNKVLQDDAQPFKHYREEHGNIPPWILFKGASFGNIVNFIKLQHSPVKNKIISMMYNIPEPVIQATPDLKNLFMDTLFICLDYRNATAHGHRIYNMTTKASFRFNPLLHPEIGITNADFRAGKGKTGIMPLYYALLYFGNKDPANGIYLGCELCTAKHIELYPDDKEYVRSYIDFRSI